MSIKIKSMRSVLLLAFLLFVGSISAQTVKVNVKDSQGEAVIGASVLEQGTRNGGVTDFDGNFTINLSAGKPIVISYIGMKTKTVNAKGKSEIAVVMEDDATTLQEVVAIGYGSVRKKDLTGSVATVSSEALQAVPVANASEALTGKMAGVNNNTPLFIVDGFPVESISDIPASDIEDITVLKDASSTAIYGSRGANGVILVTTKSGKEGKVNVAYNVFYSWKKMAKKLNTLSASDYVNYQWEYAQLRDNEEKFTNLFGNYQDADLYANAPTNDWQDQVFGRTGHTFNHNLTISGGSDKTQFNFGYAHIYDKAIMIGSGFSRDNLSLKLNADSRLKNVMIYPMFNFTDLSDGYDPDLQLTNPITSVYDTDRKQNRQTFNMNGSVTWEIIKDLKLKVELGLDWYYNTDQKYYGNSTYNARTNSVDADGTHPMAYFIDSKRQTYRNTNTLSYDFKKLLGKNSLHKLNVLLGEETINKRSSVNEDRLSHYPTSFTAEQTWSLSTQGTPYLVNKYINADDNLLSFFTRANYNYDDKYLISATFRADGSSKFAKDNRWGYFPSAAIAWRISSEPFMKSTEKWLDDLKLRLSYGTAGNNNIPSDQMAPVWSSSSSVWFNNFSSYWTTGEQASNPDLKWETTITRNIGLDFTLFRGAINGSVEYYYNSTKDLLINFPVSGSGYKYQYRNLGETQNKGVEVSLTWNAINKKNYGLTISGNIGFNKNEVVDLGSLTEYSASSGWASTTIQGDYVVKPGRPVGEIYGYKVAGRYEVSDFEDYTASGDKWVLKSGVASDASVIGSSYLRPGALKLVDTNGDGVVNSNDIDVIGDTNPTASGGFAINARAYGFDLSANFTYSIGNKVYNANKIEYTTSYQYYFRNMLDIMEAGERWTNLDPVTGLITNDATRLEELNANTTMWSPYTGNVLTDWAIEDGSFLRLSTLTLGYTLPKDLLKRIGISNLRLYTTCYNVFCLTGYSGFDPEVSTRNKTALTPGVDYSAYPKSRQFVIGLNLNF